MASTSSHGWIDPSPSRQTHPSSSYPKATSKSLPSLNAAPPSSHFLITFPPSQASQSLFPRLFTPFTGFNLSFVKHFLKSLKHKMHSWSHFFRRAISINKQNLPFSIHAYFCRGALRKLCQGSLTSGRMAILPSSGISHLPSTGWDIFWMDPVWAFVPQG